MRIPIAHDVAVGVVEWTVKLASGGVGDGEVQQAANSTRSADGARNILAPVILDDIGRAVGVGDDLLDEKPAVVKVGMRRGGRDLLHAPVEIVVAVGARPSVNQKFMTIVCHSCFFTC